MSKHPLRALFVFGAAAAFAAGCTSSSSSVTVIPLPTATPASTQTLSLGAFPASIALTTISSGVGVTGTFPAITAGSGFALLTLTGTLPGSTPAIQSTLRHLANIGSSSPNPVGYIVIVPNFTFTIASTPQLVFTIPSGISAPNGFWLAFFDSSNAAAGWNIIGGPVTASNLSVTFPAATKTLTFTQGVTYAIALIAPGGTFPSPSPSPGASASPSASPSPSPSPSASASAGPSPSPSPTPTPTPSPTPSGTPSPTPTQVALFGAFHGATSTVTLTGSGGQISLSTRRRPLSYQGYSVTFNFGANNATSPFSVTMTDATGSGDIDNPFTSWSGAGTAFLYFDIVNNSSQDVVFTKVPGATVASTNNPQYPGTVCDSGSYSSNGQSNSWVTITPSSVSPNGADGTLTFSPFTLSGGAVEFAPHNHQYLAFECQNKKLLYVASRTNSAIYGFPFDASGNVAPLVTITGNSANLNSVVGFTVDQLTGKLYALPDSGTSLLIFPARSNGNVTPTILGGSNAPTVGPSEGVTLDHNGLIYVSAFTSTVTQSCTCNGGVNVTVFAAGATGNVAPLRVIQGANTLLSAPTGMAVDANNNLWVANFGGILEEFAAGASGNVAPINTITGSNTQFTNPFSVAIDSTGRIIVPNYAGSNVAIFAANATGNATPVQNITGFAGNPRGVGVDSSDNIYVTDGSNTISVFSKTATGNATPLRTISGGNTNLLNIYYPSVF